MRQLLSFLLLGSALVGAAAPAWAGDLHGSIKLKSELAQRRIGKQKADPGDSTTAYPDRSKGGDSEIENVVVFLEGGSLKATPQKSRSNDNTLIQRDKEFIPHVLTIVKGTKVYFENQDSFAHHLYSESRPGEFEISKHTKGVRTQSFDDASVVETFCGIHTKMNCYILVLSNDYFCKVNSKGSYRLKGIPAGSYKLTAWHPRLSKPVVRTIKIEASGSKQEDIEL